MRFWHFLFILQFPIKIKLENADNLVDDCSQNNEELSTKYSSAQIFNRKVVINKFRKLSEERDGPQAPLRSICLRCILCLTISEKFDKIFDFIMDKHQEDNQVKIIALLKNNINSLCLNGFQRYDLRKYKNNQFLTDRFTCSSHIRTKLDGQWTKRLREMCSNYLLHMDVQFILNEYLNHKNDYNISQYLCNNDGIFRECRSLDMPLNIQDIVCALQ